MRKLNIATYFATILLFSCYISCIGQEISVEKIKEFIPKNAISSETIVHEGDLNHDDFKDIILRFKIENEPEFREHFHILLGQKNEIYKLVAKNDVIEIDHVDGASFNQIVIKNGYFSLEYSGFGNTSGSYHIITFKYSEEDKNWLLHKASSLLVHRYADSDYEPTEDLSTQKDFGKILFKDYGKY